MAELIIILIFAFQTTMSRCSLMRRNLSNPGNRCSTHLFLGFFIMKKYSIGDYNKLSTVVVEGIRKDYSLGLSFKEIKTKYNILDNRTLKKYLSDLLPNLSDERLISVYQACGCLNSTAKILGISRTAVWRRLKKGNIEIGSGSKTWKKVYSTLRARVVRSKWRKGILERDNYKCVKCSLESRIVHHITKLSDIRDLILKNNPHINPLNSYKELRLFTDLVMKVHDEIEGITLCNTCHNLEHSKQ